MSDDEARYRVKFRYRADTGEVEYFTIDSLDDGPLRADHDARHDDAAAELASVVERDAQIDEARGPARGARLRQDDEAESEDERTRERGQIGSD